MQYNVYYMLYFNLMLTNRAPWTVWASVLTDMLAYELSITLFSIWGQSWGKWGMTIASIACNIQHTYMYIGYIGIFSYYFSRMRVAGDKKNPKNLRIASPMSLFYCLWHPLVMKGFYFLRKKPEHFHPCMYLYAHWG
jgi:hypothetical protein